MGTQKNCLNEMVLSSTQNKLLLKLVVKKIFVIHAQHLFIWTYGCIGVAPISDYAVYACP